MNREDPEYFRDNLFIYIEAEIVSSRLNGTRNDSYINLFIENDPLRSPPFGPELMAEGRPLR